MVLEIFFDFLVGAICLGTCCAIAIYSIVGIIWLMNTNFVKSIDRKKLDENFCYFISIVIFIVVSIGVGGMIRENFGQ